MPDAYKELVENCEILEKHYQDMMVMFFTILCDQECYEILASVT